MPTTWRDAVIDDDTGSVIVSDTGCQMFKCRFFEGKKNHWRLPGQENEIK